VIALMYSNFVPSAEHLRRLEELAGSGRVAIATDEESARMHAPSTEIVLGHRYLRQLLPHAPGLRWVQTTAAGVDQLPWQELERRGILLTRNPLNSLAIAHHAVASAWALLRRLPQALQAQAEGRWAAPLAMLPLPRTALVLGLGAIGTQVARLLRGLGLRVRGTARHGTDRQRQDCDEYLTVEEWRNALGDTDILVLALPLDATTRGCIGVRELASLPRHAVLVNVAREGLVDRPALIDALRSNRLGGAALDVLDPVPLPDDPLWTMPNLLITPKVSAYHPEMQAQFETLAEAQVRRYLSGDALEFVVRAHHGV
jgi:phosphoglycerate dehydrogenase-like enzyme